jgi:hypothetical protein
MGISAYSGTTAFSFSQGTSILNVNVEYAVFAPGQYAGSDTSGGTDYIYAYQIFSDSSSTVAVDFFSVGIISGSSINTVYTDSTYGTLGGVNPFAFNFPQSAGYIFTPAALNPGQYSTVLLFSSDYAPTMGFGTVSSGGLGGMCALPTPAVPEPMTIALLIPAIAALRNRKTKINGVVKK